MKKVGEIMRDMGFNRNSSEETQKAFIKYLLRVANRSRHKPEPFFDEESQSQDEWQELRLHSKGPQNKRLDHQVVGEKISSSQPEQLSFDFTVKSSDEKAG